MDALRPEPSDAAPADAVGSAERELEPGGAKGFSIPEVVRELKPDPKEVGACAELAAGSVMAPDNEAPRVPLPNGFSIDGIDWGSG